MLRKQGASTIIVAVPVLPYDTVDIIEKQTDEFYYLIASNHFKSVGEFYEDFRQVEDEQVIQILNTS